MVRALLINHKYSEPVPMFGAGCGKIKIHVTGRVIHLATVSCQSQYHMVFSACMYVQCMCNDESLKSHLASCRAWANHRAGFPAPWRFPVSVGLSHRQPPIATLALYTCSFCSPSAFSYSFLTQPAAIYQGLDFFDWFLIIYLHSFCCFN